MDYLIHHMLRSSAARYPHKHALVYELQRLTYSDVANAVNRLANGLINAGVERGDRVGIFLEPCVPQVISIFAISQSNAAFVPINHLLFPEQVAHIINDCRMKGLITTRAKLSSLIPVLQQTPSLSFVILAGEGESPEICLPVHSFEAFCTTPAPVRRDVCIEKDLAAILYTSGSTGKAKGVMLSHAQIIAGASIVSTYLGITGSDKILAVLPFSFDAGLNQLMTAFQQGGTIVLTTFSFAREIVQVLFKEEITGLAGVPTLWTLLAQPQSTLHKTPLPHLRYITNTGGAMPQVVLATLRKMLPATKIFLMYGFTEAFRATYLPPEELDRRPTSMGKAIPNTEIMVINEHGLPCKPGEVGELVQRGPTVSLGYWEKPELTERVFRPHPFMRSAHKDSERVCYSGDLVTTDEEGFLYFVGRRDTMIKSSGYRISPTEVEEVLFQTGHIRGAAVIGVPDEVLGQHIKAFVVPKDRNAASVEALIEFCLERMPRYMVPKAIEYLDELPKTPTGKVDYQTLRRREDLLTQQYRNEQNGVAK
jgi:acyl-CoA ligase (AMP-forming) (exosortase A-associated)